MEKNQNSGINDVLLEQNTQRQLLFSAALSGNKECLEFLVKRIMAIEGIADIGTLFTYEGCRDTHNNTMLHAAAFASDKECFQYIAENTFDQEPDLFTLAEANKLFTENRHKLTPLHSAAMSLNAEVIEYAMKYYFCVEETLNIVSEFGRTPLHYLVMNDNDFERTEDKDKNLEKRYLKDIALERRKENEHLRKRAINALLYVTREGGKKIVNSGINFNIRDEQEKTVLDYVLERKKQLEEKYNKFKTKHQGRINNLTRINCILAPLASVVTTCILANLSEESWIIKSFSYISVGCSVVAIGCTVLSMLISWKKGQLKNNIKSYTERIERIEERIGTLDKNKVGYNIEEYSALMQQAEKNTKLTMKNEERVLDLEKKVEDLTSIITDLKKKLDSLIRVSSVSSHLNTGSNTLPSDAVKNPSLLSLIFHREKQKKQPSSETSDYTPQRSALSSTMIDLTSYDGRKSENQNDCSRLRASSDFKRKASGSFSRLALPTKPAIVRDESTETNFTSQGSCMSTTQSDVSPSRCQ